MSTDQIAALTKSPAKVRALVRAEESRKLSRLKGHRCEQIQDFRYRNGSIQCQVSWRPPRKGVGDRVTVWENFEEAKANPSFEKCLRALCEDAQLKSKWAPILEGELPEDKQDDDCRVVDISRELLKFDELEFHCYCILYERALTTGFVGPNFQAAFMERRRKERHLRKRELQLADLKSLSDLLTELAGVSITFENRVDFERPAPFHYVSECFSNDVQIPDDPMIGCECRSCNVHRACCPNMSGSTSFAYNRDGTLRLNQGKAIYECNKRCKCDQRCMNRVVQHGPTVPFVVFKTTDRGWGLRALAPLRMGQFVCEYVGEVVDSATADSRGKKYDSIGLTYLFDLDYNNAEKPYTIDAYEYGNMSRFMNHSCDPNCAIWVVYIDCLDPNLPRLGIFTRRSLEVGEELTFDYNVGSGPAYVAATEGDNGGAVAEKTTRVGQCFCKSKRCRSYLFEALS